MRIQQLLNEAQDGQAFANLARAFHLQPEKVEPAVAAMIADLIAQVERCMSSRRSLAALVDLLGKNIHQQVLDSPVLLGATSTQVAGNKALNVIAGHNENAKMATHAAAVADISEMIAEYLLPVIAAMLVGALARECRSRLDALTGGRVDGPADGDASVDMMQLPRASGGVGFSGSTGGSFNVAGPGSDQSRYAELADEIRRGTRAGAVDPAREVRRILAVPLGSAEAEPAGPIGMMQEWSIGTIRSILSGWRR